MKEKNKKIIALVIVIAVLIRSIFSYYNFNYIYENDSKYQTYRVKIIDIQKETNTKKSYLAALERNNKFNDKFILNFYDNLNLTLSKGDMLDITGKISIPKKLGNPRRI